MHEPGVDIVVIDHNTPDDLDRFLTSLYANPPAVPYTWHVGISGSDGSSERVMLEHRRSEESGANAGTVHGWRDNIGYNRACNRVGAAGKREVIAYCNSDVQFLAGAIDALHAAVMSHSGWGPVGPRQTDSMNRFTAAGIFGPQDKPAHRAWHRRDTGQHSEIERATYVAGSVVFIRRSHVEQLTACPLVPAAEGPWLECDHYYGDSFLSLHAAEHGLDPIYFGPVKVTHEWHRASKVGGYGEQQMEADKKTFQAACDAHGLEHE